MMLLALCLALQDDHVEKQTGLRFPKAFGELQRLEVKTFDRADLGVSIPYKIDGKILFEVFVYDLGVASIPDGIGSDAVKDHFAQVKGDVVRLKRPGGYHDVRHVSDGEAALGTAKDAPKALRAEYEVVIKEDGPKHTSRAYLLGYKNKFIKIRATFRQESAEECEKLAAAVLGHLGKEIKAGR